MVLPFHGLVVTTLYIVTGMLSFALFQQDTIVTVTIFIPEGIALAAVLIYGYRILPGIFFGQFLLALFSGIAFFPSLGIAIVNALEAFIAFKLFQSFQLKRTLEHTRDFIGLVLLIVLILQPFSALLGNAILFISHSIHANHFLQNIFFWWFGNVTGQLLVTPLLLILYYNQQKTKITWYAFTVLFVVLFNYILQVQLHITNVSLLLATTLPLTIYLATRNLSYANAAVFSLVASTLYFFHIHHSSFSLGKDSITCFININFFILSHIILVPMIGILFREKENAITTLRSLAHYDSLTGLPNRYVLHNEIDRLAYLYERYNQESMVCFIDIDGFKAVNDTYGHDVGDKLLQEVAKNIKRNIRLTDTLVRYGGDEFVLLLSNTDTKAANNLLTRVLNTIENINHIDHNTISISLSIGVACCPYDGTTKEELVHASDNAMYMIKKSSKNAIAFTQNCQKNELL